MELNTFETCFDIPKSKSVNDCCGCKQDTMSTTKTMNTTTNGNIDDSDAPKPSALRISTMTATSSINSNINLSTISSYLEPNEHIKYIQQNPSRC